MLRITQINIFFLLLLSIGCKTQKEVSKIETKIMPPSFLSNAILIIEMDLGEVILPVKIEILKNNLGEYYGIILNAEEKIETSPFKITSDSIFIRTPFFNSEFKGKITCDPYGKNISKINGVWRNNMKPGIYEIPFKGEVSDKSEMSLTDNNVIIKDGSYYYTPSLKGKWEVTFSPNTKEEYKAIGVFNSSTDEPHKITGTFMTETGDYRFLEGKGNGIDPIYLSCFDGSHAFYFDFSPNRKGDTLKGIFYSGKHWSEPWIAVRNSNFELTHPDSLTFIKDGYSSIAFSFPNLDGKKIDFPSEKFNDKVTIIQIMGSWCPNCVDETKVLSDFYNKYQSKGLEVVALCFEPSAEFEKSKIDVTNHKNYFNAQYEFLIAGQANTKKAAEALPMLNHVMSFPTTVFIDKKGDVRKIYTGFYGPSTGKYYERYMEQTTSFIEKLLSE